MDGWLVWNWHPNAHKSHKSNSDALLTGKLDDVEFRRDDNFNFLVPVFIGG